MRAFQSDSPSLMDIKNPTRRFYSLRREYMLVLDDRWQGFFYFAVNLLVEVKHILTVELRPHFSQFFKPDLANMNFIATATIAVDDATGIHATLQILKLRICYQHLIKLLGHDRPVKIDITFFHQFYKELVHIFMTLFCHLNNILLGYRERSMLFCL